MFTQPGKKNPEELYRFTLAPGFFLTPKPISRGLGEDLLDDPPGAGLAMQHRGPGGARAARRASAL